jgi:protein-tyrosine phosphatase
MNQPSILFVCMGNICRSPAAEGVFKHLLQQRGLADAVYADSAGTLGYHAGSRADARMRAAASERGYQLESRARQFGVSDFDRFDLIVAMDRDNRADILALDAEDRHRHKVRLLSDFLPAGSATDVPDPYYGGQPGFERVLDMIEAACEPILTDLVGTSDR